MSRSSRVLLTLALVAGAVVPGPARAEPPGFLDAAAGADVVVLGRAGPTSQIDRHGRVAQLEVLEILRGAPVERLKIAWEDLAPGRGPRLPKDRRVLVALDPTPGYSLWRKRFPNERPPVIAARGEAVRLEPDAQTVRALDAFLALPPESATTGAAVPALVGLVAVPDEALALDALDHLDRIPGLDAKLKGAAGQRLAAQLARGDSPLEVRRGVLRLAERRRLRTLLPAVRARTAVPGPLEAPAWQTRAVLEGRLPAAEVDALLERPDPALRAVAAGWLSGPDRITRLRVLVGTDPAGEVRASALLALGAEASTPELVEALADPDPAVARAALPAIAARGDEAVSPLTALVQRDDPAARARAIATLGMLQPEGRRILEDLARNHPDEKVRGLALLGLGRLETDPH